MIRMDDGVIIRALSGFYYVFSTDAVVCCRAKGRFRQEKITPLVGDRVRFLRLPDGSGQLQEILPRKNAFYRPPVANIDQMVLVVSEAIPVTDPFLIDRVIAIAGCNSCPCIICVNKRDLAPGDRLCGIYRAAGFQTLCTSAETGEGIEELRALTAGRISAFTGNSGVGKSSILNALEPALRRPVGEISRKLGRGKHTTRHVEFYPITGGGFIADTPGFSAFDTDRMERILKEDLPFAFQEFAPYIGKCRYADCAHLREPGCAVAQAVAEGKIQKTRYDSYVRLYERAKEFKPWETEPAQL